MDCIDNTVGNQRVKDVDEVDLVGQRLTSKLREVQLNLGPLPSVLAAAPDPLRGKLLPIREMLDPPDLRLRQQLLLSAQHVPPELRRHVPEGWCVLLHVVVEEIHQSCAIGTFF